MKLIVLVSLCLPTLGLAASAEPEARGSEQSGEREEAAEEQYQKGVEAFGEQRYLEAVDRFSRANALRPDSSLYFNIGLAFDRAGDVSNALSNYRSYLFEERTSEHTERVTARVAALEKELAKTGVQQVTIRSTPTQAQVTIDGRTVGVTPWTGDLEPGIYRVTLSRSGFETSRLEFSLSLKAALTLSPSLDSLPTNTLPPSTSEGRSGEASLVHPASTPPQKALGNGESKDVARWPDRDSEADNSNPTNIAPWIAVGAGSALGLAALGFELDRRDAIDDARVAPSRSVFDDNVTRMQRDQMAARVLGTVAVTGIVVGVVWLLLPDTSTGAMEETVALSCMRTGCNAGVRF